MTEEHLVSRRLMLGAAGGLSLAANWPRAAAAGSPLPAKVLSVTQFGAVGDGRADDTAALQAALRAAFAHGGTMLELPPGDYRVTAPLRVELSAGTSGNITRHAGIRAHGARIVSEIADHGDVLSFASTATVRYLIIEGLAIAGSGREGNGLVFTSDGRGAYLYNIALRDIVVEGCGGDGCVLFGNVFESQVFNSYFRDNRGNGMTFSHGVNGGILSAIHVFGCVFGQNGQQGAALLRGCYDVSFNGCYFLLNGCGFENNHVSAKLSQPGNAAIRLVGFGTLLACGAYSVMHQMALIDALVTGELVMIGCRGFGDATAKGAGLGRFAGTGAGRATLIGCQGAVERDGGFEPLEIAGEVGMRFGSNWQSRSLPQLGEYRLWVDQRGRLRIKRGAPASDEDGSVVSQ